MNEINFAEIEKKWQNRWEKQKVFKSTEKSDKPKYYVLEQFPYPSGSGLHVGHSFIYTIGDIYARFKRMQNFNVLYPMGFDSFGLPAENAAIKSKSHPKKFTEEAIKNFIEQMKIFGYSYDWSRMIETHKPEFYKWDQWIFLKMFEKGLAYKKEASVNWCEKCATVLANEQVINGKCWIHEEKKIEVKKLNQWFFKITNYAEELLTELEKSAWPEFIKTAQKNWIGKSHGIEILFEIENKNLNFVLLHGYTGSPHDNFFPWLKKELEKRNFKVDVPELPNTKNPNIYKQVDYVLKNYNFNENTVLLGHSLGTVVAMKVLEKLKKPIRKLVLAAGFCEPKFLDEKDPFKDLFDWKFDFKKIKKNVLEVKLLRASNDSVVPQEQSERLQKNIGGKIIDFVAEDDHLCGEEEPIVLQNCLHFFPIFTTRPDTLFGVSFMVISAQHPKMMELVTKDKKKEVENFLKKIKSTKQEDIERLDKEGVFTGSYAINPINNDKIPVYIGNFVIADYGSGMIMAVPAHDQRDFEFAKKYNLPIKQVITIDKKEKKLNEAYVGTGKLINSGPFSNLDSEEAKEHITIALKEKKFGKKVVQYKLRDWLISRQRFWGTPIPIIYCNKCGIVPVPEKELPIKLPENIKFESRKNPLKKYKRFYETKCPKCNKKALRETDTMDTFVNSSWYFLRYCDPHNNKNIFEEKKVDYWMPIDIYIGGKEHATMHDIYFRFYTKFLRDLKLLKFNEPAKRLFNQGFILGEDGNKMSKSKGNVVSLKDAAEKYGVDATRFFLVSVASPTSDYSWSDDGAKSSTKFIKKIMNYYANVKISQKIDTRIESKMNKAIKEVSSDIENFRYNLAVIKIRQIFSSFEKENSKTILENFLKILHPFCPHITEELWEKLGNKNFISLELWPSVDLKKINKEFEKEEEILSSTISDVKNIISIIKEKNSNPKSIFIYSIPNEFSIFNEEKLTEKFLIPVKIFKVNDKDKYDPENKSKKAKPGKPGIYIEQQ